MPGGFGPRKLLLAGQDRVGTGCARSGWADAPAPIRSGSPDPGHAASSYAHRCHMRRRGRHRAQAKVRERKNHRPAFVQRCSFGKRTAAQNQNCCYLLVGCVLKPTSRVRRSVCPRVRSHEQRGPQSRSGCGGNVRRCSERRCISWTCSTWSTATPSVSTICSVPQP